MADRAAYEEHILYLIIELDQALARKPQWTPGTEGRREAIAGKPIGEVTADHASVVTGQQ